MNKFVENIKRATKDLNSLKVRYALVGAFAVGVRSRPRTTKDVDFVVIASTDAEAESIVMAFQKRGYEVIQALEHKEKKYLMTVRFLMPNSQSTQAEIDILFRLCGIEKEVVENSTLIEILQGIKVQVATTGHLIALKILSCNDDLRPNDKSDIMALLAEATVDDIKVARDSIKLMIERGYGGDKNLASLLDRMILISKKT